MLEGLVLAEEGATLWQMLACLKVLICREMEGLSQLCRRGAGLGASSHGRWLVGFVAEVPKPCKGYKC